MKEHDDWGKACPERSRRDEHHEMVKDNLWVFLFLMLLIAFIAAIAK